MCQNGIPDNAPKGGQYAPVQGSVCSGTGGSVCSGIYTIIGNGVIGVSRDVDNPETGPTFHRRVGTKFYPLTDHLGSVRAVVGDVKLPASGGTFTADVMSVYDYEAYGVPRPGRNLDVRAYWRYGFQGMLKQSELSGSTTDVSDYLTPFRSYDARSGRWRSHDPIFQPWESTYLGMGGNPAMMVDPWGLNENQGGGNSQLAPGKPTAQPHAAASNSNVSSGSGTSGVAGGTHAPLANNSVGPTIANEKSQSSQPPIPSWNLYQSMADVSSGKYSRPTISSYTGPRLQPMTDEGSVTTRVAGAIRVVGAVGTIVALGEVELATGGLATPGVVVGLGSAADQLTTGFREVFTGQPQQTLGGRVATEVLSNVGVPRAQAERYGSMAADATFVASSVYAVASSTSRTVTTVASEMAAGTAGNVADDVAGGFAKTSKQAYRSFTSRNYRYNLQVLTGKSGVGMDAHHIFPQARKFQSYFRKAGINIHDPKNLVWWERKAHRSAAGAYNNAWSDFFRANPNATGQQIQNFGESLMKQYGF